ncbi:MAG: hypothetical protein ACLFUB_06205 [Cyclobacteriaceae bacterium]
MSLVDFSLYDGKKGSQLTICATDNQPARQQLPAFGGSSLKELPSLVY